MHRSVLGFAVQPLQKWMQKAATGEAEGLWWWFMARWLSEAQWKSSQVTLLFSIVPSRYSSVSVSMSTSDEKQNPNKHEAAKRETTSIPTVKHVSVGLRNPWFLLQLDTSLLPNLPSLSDLMFLEKGQCCWPHACTATFQ